MARSHEILVKFHENSRRSREMRFIFLKHYTPCRESPVASHINCRLCCEILLRTRICLAYAREVWMLSRDIHMKTLLSKATFWKMLSFRKAVAFVVRTFREEGRKTSCFLENKYAGFARNSAGSARFYHKFFICRTCPAFLRDFLSYSQNPLAWRNCSHPFWRGFLLISRNYPFSPQLKSS